MQGGAVMATAGSAYIVKSMTIEGLPELLRKLDALPDAMERKVGKKAMRDAADVVRDEVILTAPVGDTGILRDSIRTAAMRTHKGRVGFTVETVEGMYRGQAFYGAFIEFGHHTGSRKSVGVKKGEVGSGTDNRRFVPPNPFMRRAFDTVADEALRTAMETISEGLEAAVR